MGPVCGHLGGHVQLRLRAAAALTRRTPTTIGNVAPRPVQKRRCCFWQFSEVRYQKKTQRGPLPDAKSDDISNVGDSRRGKNKSKKEG